MVSCLLRDKRTVLKMRPINQGDDTSYLEYDSVVSLQSAFFVEQLSLQIRTSTLPPVHI